MFTGFCFEIILYKLFCIHTEAQCLIPKSPVQILNTYLLIMKINFLFNKSSVKTFWGNFACYKVLYVAWGSIKTPVILKTVKCSKVVYVSLWRDYINRYKFRWSTKESSLNNWSELKLKTVLTYLHLAIMVKAGIMSEDTHYWKISFLVRQTYLMHDKNPCGYFGVVCFDNTKNELKD